MHKNSDSGTRAPLPSGLIFDVARQAGISLRGAGEKRRCCCPFHSDRNPSAVVFLDNVFHCARCGSKTLKEFAAALGVPLDLASSTPINRTTEHRASARFLPAEAEEVWAAALTRARDDDFAEADADVYLYLDRRGLAEAWEQGTFGILDAEMPLPAAVRHWPGSGYRIIVPLFDLVGRLTNVQARCIRPVAKKVLFPARSQAKGVVFATAEAREILAETSRYRLPVLIGEGLTDHLALGLVSPVPVVSAPGASVAPTCIGPWVAGRELWIGLDVDEAGEKATERLARQAFASGATRVRRIAWPKGCKDACDALLALGPQELSRFLHDGMRGGEP